MLSTFKLTRAETAHNCGLKISLSLSEDKFVAISTTRGKRLWLRQKFVLGSREEVLRDRLLVGGNGHGKSP